MMKTFLDHGKLERVRIELSTSDIKEAVLQYVRNSSTSSYVKAYRPTEFDIYEGGDIEYGESEIIAELVWDCIEIDKEKRTVVSDESEE